MEKGNNQAETQPPLDKDTGEQRAGEEKRELTGKTGGTIELSNTNGTPNIKSPIIEEDTEVQRVQRSAQKTPNKLLAEVGNDGENQAPREGGASQLAGGSRLDMMKSDSQENLQRDLEGFQRHFEPRFVSLEQDIRKLTGKTDFES